MADQQKPTMVMVDVFRPVAGNSSPVFIDSVTVLKTTRRMARASALAQVRTEHEIAESVHLVTEFHDAEPTIGQAVALQDGYSTTMALVLVVCGVFLFIATWTAFASALQSTNFGG